MSTKQGPTAAASPDSSEIYKLDATAVLAALDARTISSVEVVQALIERRAAVDGQVGSFIARLDEQALAAAAQADAERAQKRPGKDRPLLGLPITIKDNIDVAGTDSTLGVRARVGKPATLDAVAVRLLREAGAIVLGKTNVPQLLLVQESDNAIFGTTRNPWSLGRSPGGSSGGEAAAIASGQSPLGIGTDIGGSIRIPAHFCGIAGLKPTVDRWSCRGMQGAFEGQELVRPQMGPMARSVRDIALALRAIDPQRSAALDPAVPPLPYGERADVRGLRIGYFADDGFLTPMPAITRAVNQAAQALREAGATLVEYTPPAAQDLIYLWLAGISSDAGKTMSRVMAGESVCKQLRPSLILSRLPTPARLALAHLFERRGDNRLARLLRVLGAKSINEVWALTAQRTRLRQAEFDAWNAAQLDAVLCPPHVLPAMPLGTSGDLTLTLSYMFRYVMLNFPAGIVPVTRVRSEETAWAGPAPLDRIAKSCSDAVRGSAGLPVGVQVIARPFREDVALAVMAAVEAAAAGGADFPRTPIDPQR